MTRPVVLSRERWEILKRRTGSEPHNHPTKIVIAQVEEIKGIIFLPAEYVPGDVVRPTKTVTLAIGGAH